jgi:hypothetical protein
MKKSVLLTVVILSQLAVAAFSAEQSATPVAASSTQAADVATPATPPGHPAMPAASPQSTAAEAPAAPVALSGKVLQTMNAGGYSYVYIEQKDGKKVWVAVAETPVKVGAEMSFKPGMEMGKFESKALKRTFDSIVFSDGVLSGAATKAAADPAKDQGTSPGSGGTIAAKAAKISVAKAAGANAYTVEEAYKNSAKLNKKKVVISGQVVKVSSGIMDRNWIHIQDGTGSEKKKTHNLVCTSKTDTADVGDVVTITGTLIKDRDFGSGYKYNVIVEDSKITK